MYFMCLFYLARNEKSPDTFPLSTKASFLVKPNWLVLVWTTPPTNLTSTLMLWTWLSLYLDGVHSTTKRGWFVETRLHLLTSLPSIVAVTFSMFEELKMRIRMWVDALMASTEFGWDENRMSTGFVMTMTGCSTRLLNELSENAICP
jgi:hypothetical protein